MKLWGGGELIRSPNLDRFQVAEHLDQPSLCEIHLNGSEKEEGEK